MAEYRRLKSPGRMPARGTSVPVLFHATSVAGYRVQTIRSALYGDAYAAPFTRATLLAGVRRRRMRSATTRYAKEVGVIALVVRRVRRAGARTRLLYLVRQQNGLGDVAHRLARVHAELLDAPERVG